jgi:hypothetical protein
MHSMQPVISNDAWCDNLTLVLDKLISKGNLAAPLRRLEPFEMSLSSTSVRLSHQASLEITDGAIARIR